MPASLPLLERAQEQAKRIALRSVRVDQSQSRSDFLTPTKDALMLLAAGCMHLSREVASLLEGQPTNAHLAEVQRQLQILAGDTETVSEFVLDITDGSLPEVPPSLFASAGVVTVYYAYDHATGRQGFALPASVPLGKRLVLHNTKYDVRVQVAGLPGVQIDNDYLPKNDGAPGCWRIPRHGGIDSGSVVVLRSAGLIGVNWVWRIESAFLTE